MERDDLMSADLTLEPYADIPETHSAMVFFAEPPLHAPGL